MEKCRFSLSTFTQRNTCLQNHGSVDGKPNIAYYVSADLKDKSLDFTTQVGNGKRLTPTQYFEQEQHPLIGDELYFL
jgi:hypothetical protein